MEETHMSVVDMLERFVENTSGRFTVLNRGKTLGTHAKGKIGIDQLQNLMAGGKELQVLSGELGGTV